MSEDKWCNCNVKLTSSYYVASKVAINFLASCLNHIAKFNGEQESEYIIR